MLNVGAGPGKKVGVVGLGGLGHYAVMIAKVSHVPFMSSDLYSFAFRLWDQKSQYSVIRTARKKTQ